MAEKMKECCRGYKTNARGMGGVEKEKERKEPGGQAGGRTTGGQML